MHTAQWEILIIAILTAVSCVLPGVFLVLRKMAMMSDAISHTILLGIVIGFFMTEDLTSPWLIVGAAGMGLVTVFLVESIQKTKLVSEDSSIGLIFPFLFSIGVILISRYAGNVHLDIDAVLLGELAFAPFDRVIWNGMDWGAKSIYVMGTILCVNLVYIGLFYKELKIVTFDPGLAAVIGISPVLIHYSLMSFVSVTAVGAFHAVGTILVVAFMIGPAAAAYLITTRLKNMIILSICFGILSTILGFWMAFSLDVSIAGSMAVMTGILFLIVWIGAPDKGMIANIRRERSQKYEFAALSLLIHIENHQGRREESIECNIQNIGEHFCWKKEFLIHILGILRQKEYIQIENEGVAITVKGKEYIGNNEIYCMAKA